MSASFIFMINIHLVEIFLFFFSTSCNFISTEYEYANLPTFCAFQSLYLKLDYFQNKETYKLKRILI